MLAGSWTVSSDGCWCQEDSALVSGGLSVEDIKKDMSKETVAKLVAGVAMGASSAVPFDTGTGTDTIPSSYILCIYMQDARRKT